MLGEQSVSDPTGRTCIVSLVNAHHRPFRLKMKSKQGKHAIIRGDEWGGPAFGAGPDVALNTEDGTFCQPKSFEMDTKAESEAGLPPIKFKYDKTILSGITDKQSYDEIIGGRQFDAEEVEVYALDG